MNATKPTRLLGTKVFLAGTKANLADPETIRWLKASGIEKVFCVFPINKTQYERLTRPQKRGTKNMEEYQKSWGIEPGFDKKLAEAGIKASSLVRKPAHIKGNQEFLAEAVKTRGNFLIQCFAGEKISAAYAMYYLAAATPLNLLEIRGVFTKSGRGKHISDIEATLRDAGINLKEVIERKQARMKKKVFIKRKRVRKKELERRRHF